MTRHPILLLALLAAAPAAAADAVWTVRPVEIVDRKAVFATVQTLQEVPARARTGGTVTRLTVREGDRVAAGDRIAVVVDQKLTPQLAALDARFQAQQAQRDQAKLDFDRADDLRRSGTGTQARLDEARTRLDVAERTLRALRAERDVVSQQSAEGTVLAPGAGRVLRVPVRDGSIVLPGETVALIATDSYILRLQLPERHAQTIARGDTILVGRRGAGDAATTQMKSGTVRLVYPQIEQGRVVADVSVPDLGDYFVGERVRVYVGTGARPALLVPEDRLYRRHGVTYVRLKDGTEVVVQPGQKAEGGIEILSGLRAGDEVVTP
jgi:multidrug efflux system membrane fusion protein